MIQLTRYRGREYFWDPFCGSGTIPIEAALIAKNRAPGLNRHFCAEEYPWMPKEAWDAAKAEARDKEFSGKYRIMGSDNDPQCVSLAFANARKAGVSDLVTFKDGDATKMDLPAPEGILICNPPYGERMMEQHSAQRLYAAFGKHFRYADGWKSLSSPPSRSLSITSAAGWTKSASSTTAKSSATIICIWAAARNPNNTATPTA